MEKKEPIKVSLPVFIAMIILLVAIVYGFFMYMQNAKLEKEIANLREEINQSQAVKNELQEKNNELNQKIESISNIASSNNEKTESTQKNTEITVKQKEEDSDTIATLYSNNRVTIKLKKSEKSQMWKYNVEDWKTAEYDKEYEVKGIEGEISKILLTNLPASDVEPALIILSEDGKISYVDFIELHNAFDNKTTIKNFVAKEKTTDIKNIVDIKKSANYSIIAIDNQGKEFEIWKY